MKQQNHNSHNRRSHHADVDRVAGDISRGTNSTSVPQLGAIVWPAKEREDILGRDVGKGRDESRAIRNHDLEAGSRSPDIMRSEVV
jgi:hypothetical protein